MNVLFCRYAILVQVCHWKVTVSLRCQLNQFYPNLLPIMPLDFKFVNDIPLEPLLCHFNHWNATRAEHQFMGPGLYSTASTQGLAPRLFPSIEGNDRGAAPWDECLILYICHPCASVPLKCHCVTEMPIEPILSKFSAKYANGLQICQWYVNWTTPVSLQPLRSH